MNFNNFSKKIFLIGISFLFSCSLKTPKEVLLAGKFEFPTFNIKANQSDIAKNATVSIIDSNFSPKKSLLTGVTLSTGSFELYKNEIFNPETGKIYLLEITKRSEKTNNQILSMQTFIFWNGDSFESITKPQILVNSKTTALFIITKLQPDLLTPNETINKIQIENDFSKISDINNNISANKFIQVKSIIESALQNNLDPYNAIFFDSDFILKVEDKKNLISGFYSSNK